MAVQLKIVRSKQICIRADQSIYGSGQISGSDYTSTTTYELQIWCRSPLNLIGSKEMLDSTTYAIRSRLR
ncbi:hypothetical protein C2S53_004989 [Perilla frutescens var. hirtella]|uniref:Uncharacterized protein n=1 Tax=Perilla frutescens var. hirtella TaxID=608512 RepID=A0AAD4INZ4_PERFH|nr:hypothetical protein C2S53_004989 [Perilla frutescens var. hirtella]